MVSKFCLPPKSRRPVVWWYLARNSMTLPSGGNSASSGFSWRKVWNGVKCNFSSAQHQNRNVDGKLKISRVRMWNFTRIGPKTKKLWLLIIPMRRRSEQPGLGPTAKRCELQLFFTGIRQAVQRLKALHLGHLNMHFQQDWPKDKKNCSSFNFLAENLEKIRSTELHGAALEGSTIFLRRNSTSCTAFQSSPSGTLKYAFSAGLAKRYKKSQLFQFFGWKQKNFAQLSYIVRL